MVIELSRLRPKRPGLAGWIFYGFLLGTACGVFLGEYAAGLAVIGEIFVGLLQMTVLPYITFALIANIGGLPRGDSKRLAVAAGGFLLVSYLAVLALVVLMPLVLPSQESASFFSTAVLEPPAEIDFVNLFIPRNPFYALANNVVPGVVLFCICVGAAIMTLPNRQEIIGTLNILTAALARVNGFLVKLAPVGVFAIAASTAGTMEMAEFERLKVYLLIYTIAAGLLGLVVLPGLLACLSPFSHGQILRSVRAPLITAFVTGKVLIVLPMLIEQTEQMFAEVSDKKEENANIIRAVTPMIYPFPHAGKLLALLFIPFSAWFAGRPLDLLQYPVFLGAGLLSFFGSPLAAMPFLLDLLELPADMFQLFLVSGIYGERLGDALGAIHILFVSVLVTAAMNGLLRWRPRRLFTFLALAAGLWAVVLVGTHAYLSRTVDNAYTKDTLVTGMHAAVHAGPATILDKTPPVDSELAALTVMERVRRTGKLRVGYHPRNLPYSFFNAEGDLVGFDVDMAHMLARDLDCGLEFVPADLPRISEQLDAGLYDLVMTGLAILPSQLKTVLFTDSYLQVTAALVVLDHHRGEVEERARRGDFSGFRVGVPRAADELGLIETIWPRAEFVPLASPVAFLESGGEGCDACIWSAEAGSAWTLLYPAFSVVLAEPLRQVPVGYPLALNQVEFVSVMNSWLDMVRSAGDHDRLYNHWILGKNTDQREPRWSVMKDVLPWVE